jgi:hypothetical protein
MRYETLNSLFITHHSLSRAAQRWGVRTTEDLQRAVNFISAKALNFLNERSKDESDRWLDTPPWGVRINLGECGGAIIVKKHETRSSLVVATVLE